MNIEEEIVTIKDLSFYVKLNLDYHKRRFKNKNEILIIDLIEMLIKGVKLKILINYLNTIYDCYDQPIILIKKDIRKIYLDQLINISKKSTKNIDNWCVLLLYAVIDYLKEKIKLEKVSNGSS